MAASSSGRITGPPRYTTIGDSTSGADVRDEVEVRGGIILERLDLVGLEPQVVPASGSAKGLDLDQALLAGGLVDGLDVDKGVLPAT
ncbi:hypothetical protein [Brachybacterium muris]|uniref:hypothetical protein n=1 Tax=Brachybacterium muris TaxID=219301 RepID=UPI00223AE7F1|nr:hypothetical protein [Brachybacterium muris]MCT1653261.1 hypothetical protein [Brachybacterium muris]